MTGGASGHAQLSIPLPDFTVRALTWGSDADPLAILLHGFPDSAHTWRHLGPQLAAKGYRVVAPFNRGYAPTDLAPDDTYQLGALVSDVLQLYGALDGDERAVIVGHDWGAMVATGVATHAPQLFSAAVILSVPPMPALFALQNLADAPLVLRQLPHSWYMSVLSIPLLSELLGDRMIRVLWRLWAPGYEGDADCAAAIAAMPDRKRRRAAYSYYRALWNPLYRSKKYAAEQHSATGRPGVRTLYLHGATDACVIPDIGKHVPDILPAGSRAVVVPDSGHFLHLEQPDVVGAHIVEFVSS